MCYTCPLKVDQLVGSNTGLASLLAKAEKKTGFSRSVFRVQYPEGSVLSAVCWVQFAE